MRYGYARVSTIEQNTGLQIDALEKSGVDFLFQEQKSGKSLKRPELIALLAKIKPGDTVVVYKLDRVARSLADLLRVTERIHETGARLESLTEHLDTKSAAGRVVFQILGAFAEFERSMIVERTVAGMGAARLRGVAFGRLPAITEEQELELVTLFVSGSLNKSELARRYGIHIASVKRALKRAKAKGDLFE